MTRSRLLIAATAILALPSMAAAQSSSLFGNRGVNASSGTLSNGVGANNSQAFGNSGNMTGFTGNTAGTQQGFASGAQSSGGLPGTGNRGFVGNQLSAASTQGGNGMNAGRSGLSSGRNGLSSGMNRLSQQGRSNRGNQNRGAAAGAQSTLIRPVQVIAFTPPKKTSESIEASINADVESAVSQGRIPGVAVNVNGEGTATIEGHVATETDRRKAEMLISLEPGVRKVVNRITVAGQ